jgi:hypothetical protein
LVMHERHAAMKVSRYPDARGEKPGGWERGGEVFGLVSLSPGFFVSVATRVYR